MKVSAALLALLSNAGVSHAEKDAAVAVRGTPDRHLQSKLKDLIPAVSQFNPMSVLEDLSAGGFDLAGVGADTAFVSELPDCYFSYFDLPVANAGDACLRVVHTVSLAKGLPDWLGVCNPIVQLECLPYILAPEIIFDLPMTVVSRIADRAAASKFPKVAALGEILVNAIDEGFGQPQGLPPKSDLLPFKGEESFDKAALIADLNAGGLRITKEEIDGVDSKLITEGKAFFSGLCPTWSYEEIPCGDACYNCLDVVWAAGYLLGLPPSLAICNPALQLQCQSYSIVPSFVIDAPVQTIEALNEKLLDSPFPKVRAKADELDFAIKCEYEYSSLSLGEFCECCSNESFSGSGFCRICVDESAVEELAAEEPAAEEPAAEEPAAEEPAAEELEPETGIQFAAATASESSAGRGREALVVVPAVVVGLAVALVGM